MKLKHIGIYLILITAVACNPSSKNHFSFSSNKEINYPPNKLTELGRYITKKEDVFHYASQDGTLVYDLCINREGKVVSAVCDEELTTITDKEMIEDIKKVVLRMEFSKDENADAVQCGNKIFRFSGF